jgi:hypothetical protein
MRVSILRSVIGMLLVSAGCDSGSPPPTTGASPLPVALESVTNADAPADTTLRITISEELRIGSATGGPWEHQLFQVAGVVRDSDDNLIVANQGTGEFRVFSANGGFVRRFGHKGDGPGEFRSMANLRLTNDTLLVNDRGLARASRFTTSGIFIDSWPTVSDSGTFITVGQIGAEYAAALWPTSRRTDYRPGELHATTVAIKLWNPEQRRLGHSIVLIE